LIEINQLFGMSVFELRAAIHQKIDSINDEFELEELNKTLDSILSDTLSEEELMLFKRLNKAIVASNEGKMISHQQVMKEQADWLRTKRSTHD
jgi:hypothetical protein